jgi:hypothetical protein
VEGVGLRIRLVSWVGGAYAGVGFTMAWWWDPRKWFVWVAHWRVDGKAALVCGKEMICLAF